jgi:DNA-binding transcriptional MerR regulator
MKAQSELQIGEVAASAGVSVDTVRFYERKRLLPHAARSAGGFRLFPAEIIKRIRFIKQAQDIGLSLDEIKELLQTGGGANECRGVRDLLRAKLTELNERMKAMKEFRGTLARHLAACERELKEHGDEAACPVVVEITRPSRPSLSKSKKTMK